MAGLLERYQALIAAGELRADPEQAAAAQALAALQEALETPPAGRLARLFGKKAPPEDFSVARPLPVQPAPGDLTG